MLGVLVATYATSPGQTYVVSCFNDSLRAASDAVDPGLGLAGTRLSAAYLVGTLLSAATLTHAGRLADRIGPRRMIALSGLGLAGAGLAFSSAGGVASLVLAFFLLRFFGQGVMSLASSHALALRFDARLGSVEGLRGATVSLAVATAPLVAVAAIERAGWRSAAWMLALGAGALAVFAALGLLDRDPDVARPEGGPARPEAGHTLAEARRTRAFWTLLGCTSFGAAYITAIHFHLQPLLGAKGLDRTAVAATFVPYALAALAGTLFGGVLVDRLRPAPLLGIAMVLLGAGGAALGAVEAPWIGHAGMAVVGAAHGLGGAVYTPTLARYFGRAHHGAIRGAAGTAGVAGSAAGPYALSATATGVGFGPALAIMSALALPAAWFAFTLLRPVAPERSGSAQDRAEDEQSDEGE